MGGKKRSKFERVYTDDETSSSEESDIESILNSSQDLDEFSINQQRSSIRKVTDGQKRKLDSGEQETDPISSSKVTKSQKKEDEDFQNTNNNAGKLLEGKFLVTRSKKKYKKRELKEVKSADENKQKGSTQKEMNPVKETEINSVKTINTNNEDKREVILKDRDFKSQISQAKEKLDELNRIIKQKDIEIESLKNVSNDANEITDNSQKIVRKAIETVTTPTFNFVDDRTSTESELEEVEIEQHKKKKKKRDRSRGRSRSRGREVKKRKRSRTRSRSRGNRHADLESPLQVGSNDSTNSPKNGE